MQRKQIRHIVNTAFFVVMLLCEIVFVMQLAMMEDLNVIFAEMVLLLGCALAYACVMLLFGVWGKWKEPEEEAPKLWLVK